MSNTKKSLLIVVLPALVLLAVLMPVKSGLSVLFKWSQMNQGLAVLAFLVLIVLGMVIMVVILTRLSMILPYNLLNYSLGLTAVRLRDYLIGSAIGMVPGIFLFVFIGAGATDIAAILSGELTLGDYDWLIGGFGLLTVATVVAIITRVAQKALKEELENSE